MPITCMILKFPESLGWRNLALSISVILKFFAAASLIMHASLSVLNDLSKLLPFVSDIP